MKITEIKVRNYKSLRDVTWTPGQMSVVVGANGSGKSNLADFFDFLSDVYTDGLSKAVVRKGGYENITHRKSRRAKGGVTVELHAEAEPERSRAPRRTDMRSRYKTRLLHRFSFRAEGDAIMAEFKIVEETIKLDREIKGAWKQVFSLTRKDDKVSGRYVKGSKKIEDIDDILARRLSFFLRRGDDDFFLFSDKTELLFGKPGLMVPHARPYLRALPSLRVLQINTTAAREPGVPASDQVLGRQGEQLPVVIDWLKQKKPRIWDKILGMMQEIMPDLEKIEVDYTDFKKRGVFFHEAGISRPWRVDEISDGTIHSLAFFVALFDPRPAMVVIEEPENSVHAWILREMMEEVRAEAEEKQIVLTTHSPFVVDAVRPEDVWVIWRENAESKIERFLDIDGKIKKSVLEGGLTVFDHLNMGAVRKAVPHASSAAAAE